MLADEWLAASEGACEPGGGAGLVRERPDDPLARPVGEEVERGQGAWITGWTRLVSYSRRYARRKPARAALCSWCCRPRRGQQVRKPGARPCGCAQTAASSRDLPTFASTHIHADVSRCGGGGELHLGAVVIARLSAVVASALAGRGRWRSRSTFWCVCLQPFACAAVHANSCRPWVGGGLHLSAMVIACFPAGLIVSGLPGILERTWRLPVGLLAAGLLAVLVGRVWGRHRLAAAGSWWELHLGERVSRSALEAFTRTLAGGLPRPLLGARPWVALSVSSEEDRAGVRLVHLGRPVFGAGARGSRASPRWRHGRGRERSPAGSWRRRVQAGYGPRAGRLAFSAVACRSPR